jgi:cellulose synthase/poly-beta-1,6-N-acetylglucosamine synthase-like glycosyltransferase
VGRSSDWYVDVVYDRDASVVTSAEKSLKQFLSQRVRWVMGGQAARSWSQIPLHIIFVFHACLAIFLPLMFFVHSLIPVFLLAILTKVLLDFVRCWRVCREFGRLGLLRLFVPYEIFMVSYSIIAGLGSIFIRKIRWKGETYVRNAHRVGGI